MNIQDLKVQLECAHAAGGGASHGLSARGHAKEDLWFHEHERELIEAARARQAAGDMRDTSQKTG
jgi:hypothetical protein